MPAATTPTTTTPTTEPPVTPPMPEKPNKLLIVLMVLVLLLLGATGYLAYQNYQLRQQLSQTSPVQSPVSTPDPTADWQTYANEEYGFSIKYPPEWTVKGESIPQVYSEERGLFPIAKGDVGLGDINSDTDMIEITIFDLTNADHAARFEENLDTALKKEAIELGDKTFEKFTGVNINIAPDSYKRFDFWTLKSLDEKLFAKIQIGHRPTGSTVDELELRLILSTLKFLD